MQQGALPFHYAEEKNSTGMTALAGLATYLNLLQVSGLKASVERHVGIRRGTQGWTDSQMVTSLILLNLAGGESVDDLRAGERRRVRSGIEEGRDARDAPEGASSVATKMAQGTSAECAVVLSCVPVCRSSKKKRRSVSRTPRSYPLRQMR